MAHKGDLWALLNAGKTITNGDNKVWYSRGQLHCEPRMADPLAFQRDEEDEWGELREDEEQLPTYCRWYYVKNTGEIVIDNNTFHPMEKLPTGLAKRVDEALTKAELVGNS